LGGGRWPLRSGPLPARTRRGRSTYREPVDDQRAHDRRGTLPGRPGGLEHHRPEHKRIPDVARELRRLTPPHRWLIALLHHPQVFSTEQVAALAFDNVHTARNRLNQLGRRGVLERFRDAVRPGSQSWRWTLGWIGAAYLAYRDGHPVPRPGTIA